MMLPPDHAHREDAHAERRALWAARADLATALAEHLDHLGVIVFGIIINAALCLLLAPFLGEFIGLMLGVTLSYAVCVAAMITILILTALLTFVLGRHIPTEHEREAERAAHRMSARAAQRAALEADFEDRCERARQNASARGKAAIDAIMSEHNARRILREREQVRPDPNDRC